MERTAAAAPVEENMAPKKHFLVFCAIFFTVALLLGLGAWHTRAAIESRGASNGSAEPAGGPGPGRARAAPALQRFANPRAPAGASH